MKQKKHKIVRIVIRRDISILNPAAKEWRGFFGTRFLYTQWVLTSGFLMYFGMRKRAAHNVKACKLNRNVEHERIYFCFRLPWATDGGI